MNAPWRLSSGVSDLRQRTWTRIALLFGAVVLLFTIGIAADRFLGRNWTIESADQAAIGNAQVHAGLLASELQKYRLLPVVLADDSDVHAALSNDERARRRLEPKLEMLAKRTSASVIYVLDRGGEAIAASNWQSPTSFVGHRFAFRSYFTDALAHGSAEQFALGQLSHEPGLFLAQRISDPATGEPLGVVVVKVEFGGIEAAWAHQKGATMVVDRQGVVVLTSRPSWRFRTVSPMPREALQHIRQSVQFGDSTLAPLPISRTGKGSYIDADGERFVVGRVPAAMKGCLLLHLEPLQPFETALHSEIRKAALAAALATLVVIILLLRHYDREHLRQETQRHLEEAVGLRTAELRAANDRLRKASDDLAHANRLGIIGQITTGVAHEVNQPVAAIRSFAENALQLLKRGDREAGISNISTIVDLTVRIGQITQELRGFARASPLKNEAVNVRHAIDGALLLLDDRIQAVGAKIRVSDFPNTLAIQGERVRLEQILINLLQNALEATSSQIDVRVHAERDWVVIRLEDNGPGIAPEVADTLFTPLVTGRSEGLGLGLGIARDIARVFGGDLDQASSSLGGAGFRLRLRRANV